MAAGTAVAAAGAWFRPRRAPGRLAAVLVTRLVGFQVIQVGLLAAAVQGGWVAVLGCPAAAVATGIALGRWRGRWLTEHAAIWSGYRRRRGTGRPGSGDPRLAALGELVPDLLVENIRAAEPATRWGMGSDDGGWFAVLEVDTAAGAVQPPVPLSALARVAAEAEQAGVVVQVVSLTIPVVTEPGAGSGSKQHQLWVAVRLDAREVAASMVDHPDGGLDVPVVLAEITRRIGRVLRRRGLAARVLDADRVLDALVHACDLAPAELAWPAREAWHSWYSRRFAHRCFWLRAWPDRERGTELLAALGALPGAGVSIALVLTPRAVPEGEADLRCLVRIAAEPEWCRLACDRAQRLAERSGGWLFPLDGEQALAVYGTAPGGAQ